MKLAPAINHRFRKYLIALFCISLGAATAALGEGSKSATADYVSSNGAYKLSVTPATGSAGARSGARRLPPSTCDAVLFHKKNSGTTEVIWRGHLINEIAPANALVMPDGSFFATIDDTFTGGYGKTVVVIYGRDGKTQHQFSLENILTNTEIAEHVSIRERPPFSTVENWPTAMNSREWLDGEPFLDEGTADIVLPTQVGFRAISLRKGLVRIPRPSARKYPGSDDDALRKILGHLHDAVAAAVTMATSPDSRRRFSRSQYSIYLIAIQLSGLEPEKETRISMNKKIDAYVMKAVEKYDTTLYRRLVASRDNAMMAQSRAVMRGLQTALEQYLMDAGRYPNDKEGLAILAEGGTAYVTGNMLIDPWGHPFIYFMAPSAKENYRISSSGPDGIAGTSDDISILSN